MQPSARRDQIMQALNNTQLGRGQTDIGPEHFGNISRKWSLSAVFLMFIRYFGICLKSS